MGPSTKGVLKIRVFGRPKLRSEYALLGSCVRPRLLFSMPEKDGNLDSGVWRIRSFVWRIRSFVVSLWKRIDLGSKVACRERRNGDPSSYVWGGKGAPFVFVCFTVPLGMFSPGPSASDAKDPDFHFSSPSPFENGSFSGVRAL